MKLLFLISNRSLRGGVYSVTKFAQALARRGHLVTLASIQQPLYFREAKNEMHTKLRHQIPGAFKGCGALDRLWSRVYDISILSSFITRYRPDYIFGVQKRDAIRAVRLGKKHEIPVANFVFETPDWIQETWKKFDDLPQFQRSWEEFGSSLLASDRIIANSHLTALEIQKWLGRKADVVATPGIDKEAADSIPQPRKCYQVIHVGALEERKNIDQAIIALSKLRSPPTLVICGEGDLRLQLKRLAGQLGVECQFKGAVTDYEKWLEIKKSLFMVFPTSFEGFGMPPAEALYCGIPCVSSDLPVLRRTYRDTLEYFSPNTPETLALKMGYLLKHPGYRKRRGEGGRKYVGRRLCWQKSAEEIERCIAWTA